MIEEASPPEQRQSVPASAHVLVEPPEQRQSVPARRTKYSYAYCEALMFASLEADANSAREKVSRLP
jgi:hypothetical protein